MTGMQKITNTFMAFSLLLYSVAAAEPPPAANSTIIAIRDLTGAPARIVWCQDMGDDSDAGDTRFRLMGFDTEDQRGERPIIQVLSDYVRPLFAPRGDRVIFSNRRDNKIYIVNWNGGNLHCLGNGCAVGVWLDPASGVEWVYGGTPVPNSTAFFPIQRAPIDQPDQIETVWSRTPVDTDNFQLSADGRRACGTFPWPHCGTAELPNGNWKKYGDGCWPSLAPGNVNLLWIFDGAHRNLTLFRTDGDERWVVNINHAPGIDGYEVYHPRWANHPRFIVLTGPYKVGEGDNRIRGGGPEVEIHLGRFDERFRAIERWVRVTHNTRADFFPDAWIAPTSHASAGTAPAVPGAARSAAAAWPVNAERLVFLWENRSRKNEITNAADQSPRICRAEPRGEARYSRHFGMDLSRGIFDVETGTAGQLLAAVRNSNRFCLEAVLTPRQGAGSDSARIISFADTESGNFALSQQGNRLMFRLNTTDTGNMDAAIPVCVLTSGAPHHVVINYLPGRLTCFLNGSPVLLTNAPTGNLAEWTPGELIFGDRTRSWPGSLDHIALYSRALEESEVRANFEALADELKRRAPARRVVIEARLAETAAVPTPASISPYRRALAADRYDGVRVMEGHCDEKQILAAHWAILDGRTLDPARRQKDKVYRMILEAFDEHPELEGERLVMEGEDYALPLYYEVQE